MKTLWNKTKKDIYTVFISKAVSYICFTISVALASFILIDTPIIPYILAFIASALFYRGIQSLFDMYGRLALFRVKEIQEYSFMIEDSIITEIDKNSHEKILDILMYNCYKNIQTANNLGELFSKDNGVVINGDFIFGNTIIGKSEDAKYKVQIVEYLNKKYLVGWRKVK